MAKPPAVQQTYYYAASPRRVFSALTTPEGLTRWFLERAEIEPREEAPFRFTWRGGYTMEGKVRAVRPARMVEFAWTDRLPPGKVLKTVARFELRKSGKGTLLTLTHRGFKNGRKWVRLYGAVESGWAYYLTNLRAYLEHGMDLRSDRDILG